MRPRAHSCLGRLGTSKASAATKPIKISRQDDVGRGRANAKCFKRTQRTTHRVVAPELCDLISCQRRVWQKLEKVCQEFGQPRRHGHEQITASCFTQYQLHQLLETIDMRAAKFINLTLCPALLYACHYGGGDIANIDGLELGAALSKYVQPAPNKTRAWTTKYRQDR